MPFCSSKCSKTVLVFMNMFFWVSGCVIIGLGACILASPGWSHMYRVVTATYDPMDPEEVIYIVEEGLMNVGYSLLIIGFFVLISGFLGCCGIIQDRKYILIANELSKKFQKAGHSHLYTKRTQVPKVPRDVSSGKYTPDSSYQQRARHIPRTRLDARGLGPTNSNEELNGLILPTSCGKYFICLFTLLITELSVALATMVYREQILTGLQDRMTNAVQHYYAVDTAFTNSMDYTQFKFHCCGSRGAYDYELSKWINTTNPLAKNVPLTCCPLTNRMDDDAYLNPRPSNEHSCQDGKLIGSLPLQNVRYKKGCYDILERWIKRDTSAIIGASVGMATIEVFGMIFTVCLCRYTEDNF